MQELHVEILICTPEPGTLAHSGDGFAEEERSFVLLLLDLRFLNMVAFQKLVIQLE